MRTEGGITSEYYKVIVTMNSSVYHKYRTGDIFIKDSIDILKQTIHNIYRILITVTLDESNTNHLMLCHEKHTRQYVFKIKKFYK